MAFFTKEKYFSLLFPCKTYFIKIQASKVISEKPIIIIIDFISQIEGKVNFSRKQLAINMNESKMVRDFHKERKACGGIGGEETKDCETKNLAA